MKHHKIIWLFRKKRPHGNFSIENSFSTVQRAWRGKDSPSWYEIARFSDGILNRVVIIFETRNLQPQILHITGDIHFAALAWPQWRGNRPKVVLTIHDIGFLKDLSGLKKWLMQKFWLEWPLRCVDHLVVVSDATKQTVLDVTPWFPETAVSVIPTVVPQHFSPRKKQPDNPKPVALHIGLAENKNLKRHAEAIHGMSIHLKIIGELNAPDLEVLNALDIDFSWKSRLSDAEMQSEYDNADFLLFASTLEGFGMPIIEANMVGVPVITSDLEPMKSVAGDAALLCNPLDISSIRSAIQCITKDELLRHRLIQNGFENVKRFSPEKSAHLHQELYDSFTHA